MNTAASRVDDTHLARGLLNELGPVGVLPDNDPAPTCEADEKLKVTYK